MTKTINLFAYFLFAVAAFLNVAFVASADTVVRTGETVSVTEEAGITGDFYAAGSIINVSGSVEGDFTAAGGRTTLNGEISEDALIVGGSIDVHGSVGDDLRVIGGEVVIAEPITGDVFVLGGSVSILSTASVGGDVLVFGGDVEISGPVGGDVLGRYGSLRIDAAVAGDVDVSTSQLVLGDRAAVEGNVTYVSTNLVTRSQDATVGGNVVRNDPVIKTSPGDFKSALVPVLVLLFTVLVWFLIARSFLQKVVFTAVSRRPRPVLLGFATLLLAPFAMVILAVSVLGTLVGIIGLFMYLTIVLLSVVAVSAVLGHLILKALNQPTTEVTLYTLGAGVLGMTLLTLVPFVGPLLIFAVFIVSLGAIVESVFYPHNL